MEMISFCFQGETAGSVLSGTVILNHREQLDVKSFCIFTGVDI